jgi:hypothetical protein
MFNGFITSWKIGLESEGEFNISITQGNDSQGVKLTITAIEDCEIGLIDAPV